MKYRRKKYGKRRRFALKRKFRRIRRRGGIRGSMRGKRFRNNKPTTEYKYYDTAAISTVNTTPESSGAAMKIGEAFSGNAVNPKTWAPYGDQSLDTWGTDCFISGAGTGTTQPASEAYNCFILNPVTVGTGQTERIGRKLAIKSINIKLALANNYSNNNGMGARVILLWTKNTLLKASLTLDNILSLSNRGSAGVAPINLLYTQNFIVLKDVFLPLVYNQLLNWNFFKRCNLVTEFNSSVAGTKPKLADYASGCLLLYVIAINNNTNSSIEQNNPYCKLYCRLRFTDP